MSAISNPGYASDWDSVSSVRYFYNRANRTFASNADTESLTRNGRYVLDHRLGDIMFWDYESDPPGPLLATVNHAPHCIFALHQEAQ
jgi:chitinase